MYSPLNWLGFAMLCGFAATMAIGQTAQPKDYRKEVATELKSGLEKALAQKEPAERHLALAALAKKALPQVTANILVSDNLRQALGKSIKMEDADAALALEKAVRESLETLTFEPTMEAPFPEGFPQPTPVGEIRVQSFPTYRLARVAMKKSGDSIAFFTLFAHISTNKIEMTAPVEMTRSKDSAEVMAFLYQNTKLGKLGKDGSVEVVDVAPMTALSLGLRGKLTDKRVAEALGQLEIWLKQHAAEYEATGPLRVMGYNSPFLAAERQYVEVQIPVRKVK